MSHKKPAPSTGKAVDGAGFLCNFIQLKEMAFKSGYQTMGQEPSGDGHEIGGGMG